MLARRAIRVRRYLPAKLSAPEIAGMPCLPLNTTRTRMRHLCDKRGAHRRHQAVEQAGALGLLAPLPLKVIASASPAGRSSYRPAGPDGTCARRWRWRPRPRAPYPPAAASRVAGASHPAV